MLKIKWYLVFPLKSEYRKPQLQFRSYTAIWNLESSSTREPKWSTIAFQSPIRIQNLVPLALSMQNNSFHRLTSPKILILPKFSLFLCTFHFLYPNILSYFCIQVVEIRNYNEITRFRYLKTRFWSLAGA